MMKVTSTTKRLRVEVDDSGVVGHVGLWLLGRFADRLGVGDALSGVFDRSGVVHDRGKVLVHAMLMLAGGGECCTDVEFLRSEPGLFGSTASDSTLYRTMRSIDKQTGSASPGRWPGFGNGYGTKWTPTRPLRWCWTSTRRFMWFIPRTRRVRPRRINAATGFTRFIVSPICRGSACRCCYVPATPERTP